LETDNEETVKRQVNRENEMIEQMISMKCRGYREDREFGSIDRKNFGETDYWRNAPIKQVSYCPTCRTSNLGNVSRCSRCYANIDFHWHFLIWSKNGKSTINAEQYIKKLENKVMM
jgi:hypothetical protein